jgi:disintegrin and metalloproteinase domain-containing protein 10
LAYGLESCQCIPGPSDQKTKSCELCCKIPGENNPCKSSFDWNKAPYDVPDMFAKPGTPCNDYIGYCDVFQKCREVDPSGPLATLRKLLLSEESIASFKKWVISNWYAVSLIIVAVFALLVSFAFELKYVYFCFQTITPSEFKSQKVLSHHQKMGKIRRVL